MQPIPSKPSIQLGSPLRGDSAIATYGAATAGTNTLETLETQVKYRSYNKA